MSTSGNEVSKTAKKHSKGGKHADPEPAAAAPARLQNKMIGKLLRISAPDGRVVIGTCVLVEGNGNVILQNVSEFREYLSAVDQSKQVIERPTMLVVIPAAQIVTMHEKRETTSA